MYDIYVMQIDPNLNTDQGIPVRYYDTHLQTINRIVQKAKTEYVWVLSNECSYVDFNFNYVPAPWESKQIHCWASNDQQQGDTFLIPVNEFKRQFPLERLEYFKDIQYHHPGVYREQPDHHQYKHNLTNEIKQATFKQSYTVFECSNDTDTPYIEFTPSLWKDRAVYPLNKSGSITLVPRECNIQDQVYDYEYINTEMNTEHGSELQDIIFIDNGEQNADQNYETLLDQMDFKTDRIHRSSSVTGRTKAYQAAANLSRTPWFFAVFAKCKVHPDFKFMFQPDYLQNDKHYIFHSINQVNGLEYGHQAVILYNKNLVLNQNTPGIDFTMSDDVEVVPILSCTVQYTDPEQAWRTAFRECIKLKLALTEQPSIETEYRLMKWQSGTGEFAEDSIKGAKDGIKFFDDSKGHYPTLQKTFDWAFCHECYLTLNSQYLYLESKHSVSELAHDNLRH